MRILTLDNRVIVSDLKNLLKLINFFNPEINHTDSHTDSLFTDFNKFLFLETNKNQLKYIERIPQDSFKAIRGETPTVKDFQIPDHSSILKIFDIAARIYFSKDVVFNTDLEDACVVLDEIGISYTKSDEDSFVYGTGNNIYGELYFCDKVCERVGNLMRVVSTKTDTGCKNYVYPF